MNTLLELVNAFSCLFFLYSFFYPLTKAENFMTLIDGNSQTNMEITPTSADAADPNDQAAWRRAMSPDDSDEPLDLAEPYDPYEKTSDPYPPTFGEPEDIAEETSGPTFGDDDFKGNDAQSEAVDVVLEEPGTGDGSGSSQPGMNDDDSFASFDYDVGVSTPPQNNTFTPGQPSPENFRAPSVPDEPGAYFVTQGGRVYNHGLDDDPWDPASPLTETHIGEYLTEFSDYQAENAYVLDNHTFYNNSTDPSIPEAIPVGETYTPLDHENPTALKALAEDATNPIHASVISSIHQLDEIKGDMDAFQGSDIDYPLGDEQLSTIQESVRVAQEITGLMDHLDSLGYDTAGMRENLLGPLEQSLQDMNIDYGMEVTNSIQVDMESAAEGEAHESGIAALFEEGGPIEFGFSVAGVGFLAYAVGADAVSIFRADDPVFRTAEVAGHWAGAAAAAAAAEEIAAPVILAAGPFGWAVGAFVGLAAGAAGYWAGEQAVDNIYHLADGNSEPTEHHKDALETAIEALEWDLEHETVNFVVTDASGDIVPGGDNHGDEIILN